MKKVLSLILAVLMLVSICPVVFAENYKNGTKVEFGSYPQTQVTDEALIQALNAETATWYSYNYSYRLSGTDLVQNGDYMKYCDVTYNGAKYRGVKMTAYRPDRTDSYFTTALNPSYDLNTVYWFKYEPLIWQVLDIDKGLLLCDQIIDSQPFFSGTVTYNASAAEKYRYTSTANSSYYPNQYIIDSDTICGWLRTTFKKTAFSETEKKQLQSYSVTSDATDTKFKFTDITPDVFLLSKTEARAYMSTHASIVAKSSDYAKIQGVDVFNYASIETEFEDGNDYIYGNIGNSPWLLTTAGYSSETVICISETGADAYNDVRYTGNGVRPAIKLETAFINRLTKHTTHSIVVGEGKEPTCTNPGTCFDTGSYCTLCNYHLSTEYTEHIEHDMGEDHKFTQYQTACEYGDAVMFGSYPQSLVNDSDIISQLNTMALEWKSYDYYTYYNTTKDDYAKSDYMKYTDVDIDGDGKNDYRGVLFTEYRPCSSEKAKSTDENNQKNSVQYKNDYRTNTVYWFKYEPLVWRVLDRENGVLMCEYAIDSQSFNDTLYEIDKNGNTNIEDNEYFADKKGESYAGDYSVSTLHKFLNGLFLSTAFSSSEKKNIADTTVSAADEYTYNCTKRSEYFYSTVTDKVFLLSYDEYMSSGLINSSDEKLKYYPTDYAKCQGCYVLNDSTVSIHFRTAVIGEYYHCNVTNGTSDDAEAINDSSIGVCPVIKVNNIEDLLHIHTIVYSDAVPVSCTKDGKTQGVSCSTCKEVFVKQEKIAKTGHNPVLLKASEPTCETNGNTECYQCENCKKYYTDEICSTELQEKDVIIPALGHEWSLKKTVKAATCTEKGSGEFECTRKGCTATKTDEIAALGHNPEKVEAVAATCSSTGIREYYICKNENCEKYFTTAKCTKETTIDNLTVKIDKTNHQGETEVKNASDATCGKDGYTGDTYCKACGAEISVGTVIKSTGKHNYTGAVKNNGNGTHSFKCTGCEAYGGTVNCIWDTGKVTRAAQVGVEGEITYTCTVCNATKTEKTEALKDDGYTPGDVDSNGNITAADARLALRASVGLEGYKEGSKEFKACDIDKNGKITSADARTILRGSVGLEDPEAWKK